MLAPLVGRIYPNRSTGVFSQFPRADRRREVRAVVVTQRGLAYSWLAGRAAMAADAKSESQSIESDAPRQSGVRARTTLCILVVEPDNFVRDALEGGAREDAVRFVMAATPAEAAAV